MMTRPRWIVKTASGCDFAWRTSRDCSDPPTEGKVADRYANRLSLGRLNGVESCLSTRLPKGVNL